MASLWSGTITFGLVSIPIRLETSQRSRDLSFNLLHKECGQRINQKYYCRHCEAYLERSDLARGYQYEKDRYVVMDPKDFEVAEGEASRNIEVLAFIDRRCLQPSHLNRTYYLVPEAGAEKAYLLLFQSMQELDRVAVTRFVMRGKEYIGAVSFQPPGLILHILYRKGEFRHIEEVLDLPELELSKKEIDLARQIVENLTEEFSEDMLVGEHRERLLEVIRKKIEGEQITVSEPRKPGKVVDLMEALRQSLDATARKKPAARVGAGAEERKKRKRA